MYEYDKEYNRIHELINKLNFDNRKVYIPTKEDIEECYKNNYVVDESYFRVDLELDKEDQPIKAHQKYIYSLYGEYA